MAKVIMDEEQMNNALTRMAFEIMEAVGNEEEICLVGIQRRGVYLAKMLCEKLKAIQTLGEGNQKEIFLGSLDVTFYRDDLALLHDYPENKGNDIAFPVDNKSIVLVDDVLYTGRTIRAAIDALFEFGRPKSVKLAILIDRGHRELPFRADFVGKNVPTSKSEDIGVKVAELDSVNQVEIL